jgi:hypothetical protein
VFEPLAAAVAAEAELDGFGKAIAPALFLAGARRPQLVQAKARDDLDEI